MRHRPRAGGQPLDDSVLTCAGMMRRPRARRGAAGEWRWARVPAPARSGARCPGCPARREGASAIRAAAPRRSNAELRTSPGYGMKSMDSRPRSGSRASFAGMTSETPFAGVAPGAPLAGTWKPGTGHCAREGLQERLCRHSREPPPSFPRKRESTAFEENRRPRSRRPPPSLTRTHAATPGTVVSSFPRKRESTALFHRRGQGLGAQVVSSFPRSLPSTPIGGGNPQGPRMTPPPQPGSGPRRGTELASPPAST